MSNTNTVLTELNELLRGYNYLGTQDEDIKLEELPSLVSHLLLIKIFTHEGMNLGIAYDDVDDFCEFSISKVYANQSQGKDEEIDLAELVKDFKASNVKH